ncbi:MAG: hypothetical protein KDC44_09275 [Phaeodactylibacter sp.]|nr:hypothetical protein [Phaeodactylibacter sp.]
MFLVNWFQSNLMVAFTLLVLIGIPVVVLFITFTKKPNTPEDEPEA